MAVVSSPGQRNRSGRVVRITAALAAASAVAVVVGLGLSQTSDPAPGGSSSARGPATPSATASRSTPASSTATAEPQRVVVVGRVDTGSGGLLDSPALLALISVTLGAAGSYAVATVVGKRQRAFDRLQARDERSTRTAEARAAAAFARFQVRLERERTAVHNATATLHSLRVLAAILDVESDPPDQRIADLPVDPAAFPDQDVQAGLDRIATELMQYRVCSEQRRVAIRDQLRAELRPLLPDVEQSVAALSARFATLSTDGVKQAEADADAAIAAGNPD